MCGLRDTDSTDTIDTRRHGVARLVALATVAAFVVYPWLRNFQQLALSDELLVLFALVLVIILRDGDASRLGLRLHPIQGWWHWCRLAMWIALAIGTVLLAWTALIYFANRPVVVPRLAPGGRLWMFGWMCLRAPLIEELVFRSLFTVAAQPTLGDRGTIILGGLLFAVMHIVGGNPSPENQIGGFLLMWAFLRSGTVLVPLAWHSAGNFAVFVGHVANWYLLPPVWP